MLSNRQDREGKGTEEGKKAFAERRLTGSGDGACEMAVREMAFDMSSWKN